VDSPTVLHGAGSERLNSDTRAVAMQTSVRRHPPCRHRFHPCCAGTRSKFNCGLLISLLVQVRRIRLYEGFSAAAAFHPSVWPHIGACFGPTADSEACRWGVSVSRRRGAGHTVVAPSRRVVVVVMRSLSSVMTRVPRHDYARNGFRSARDGDRSTAPRSRVVPPRAAADPRARAPRRAGRRPAARPPSARSAG
jgi:hypothetical protein